MCLHWFKRRAHLRRLANGTTANVRQSWVIKQSSSKDKKRRYRHECPKCGAQILSVNMPNGGWAHFEGRKGLGRVKHPCLHLGETLSRRRDEKTLDLFEMMKE